MLPRYTPVFATFFFLLLMPPANAQQKSMPDMQMDHRQMQGMNMSADQSLIQTILHHSASGTSVEPDSTPVPMMMRDYKGWTLMLHGMAIIADQQQSGPRGADKLYSVNWIMPMAQRPLGPGLLTLRAMFSLEPATISGRQFPEMFQQGETAFGNPIVDGQHPHDLFMELGALYDIKLGQHALLSFYAAPVGDPAIGPTAYPHRASASENPLAALGHHQQDSTHIAYNVFTAGLTYGKMRLEASGFHGREPGENRWTIYGGAVDSYSARLTVSPTHNLTAQYSIARIASPEALYPEDNQQRQTASLMYNHVLQHGNWASTFVWGRTRSLSDGAKQNSYLVESKWNFAQKNNLWTRIENASRTNELELTPGTPLPAGFVEDPIGHVQAYSFGYDRQFTSISTRHISTAMGAQFTLYNTPRPLVPEYGSNPVGVAMFLRLGIR